jgi:inorganic pyrophosphatase
MNTILDSIEPERMTPDLFVACIEISKGSNMKYELDKKTGLLILDRILFTSTHYPANYGFLPLTLAEDKDPLDVLVLASEPLIPNTLVRCVPIGVISMIDGEYNDDKIIAVAQGDPDYMNYKTIEELPPHIFQEMRHFFSVYKELENKKTSVHEVQGVDRAKAIIKAALEAYKKANQPSHQFPYV